MVNYQPMEEPEEDSGIENLLSEEDETELPDELLPEQGPAEGKPTLEEALSSRHPMKSIGIDKALRARGLDMESELTKRLKELRHSENPLGDFFVPDMPVRTESVDEELEGEGDSSPEEKERDTRTKAPGKVHWCRRRPRKDGESGDAENAPLDEAELERRRKWRNWKNVLGKDLKDGVPVNEQKRFLPKKGITGTPLSPNGTAIPFIAPKGMQQLRNRIYWLLKRMGDRRMCMFVGNNGYLYVFEGVKPPTDSMGRVLGYEASIRIRGAFPCCSVTCGEVLD